LYSILNEQNKTITELWDGVQLKSIFRKCVDRRVFQLWEEVVILTSEIVFTDEDDEPIWQFAQFFMGLLFPIPI
jgi:hypothetical protein